MLKGRFELENFSGETVEAVRQDVHAAVLLANLESLLSEPAQTALQAGREPESQRLQVNRSNSYHGLKLKLLELLHCDTPGRSACLSRPQRLCERG